MDFSGRKNICIILLLFIKCKSETERDNVSIIKTSMKQKHPVASASGHPSDESFKKSFSQPQLKSEDII